MDVFTEKITFCVILKIEKNLSFFYLYFGKIYNKGQNYNKAYLERFNVGMRLMNTSLDIHVNNLSNKIITKSVNIAWNVRLPNMQRMEIMMHWSGAKNGKIVNKVSDYSKKYKEIYWNCDCYLEYTKVIRNMYFMFEYLRYGKTLLLLVDYFISKFPTKLKYKKKDLEKSILSLRKGVMCYEYVDLWSKYNERSLPPKELLFSKLKNKGMETTNLHKNHGMCLTRK